MKKAYIKPTVETIHLFTEGAVADQMILGSNSGDQMLSNKKGHVGGGWDSDNWTEAGEDYAEE